jgi:hypothetical protein
MRNQNNTRTEFHIAKTSCAIANQLQCRYRAIDSGVLAISRAFLSGDVVLDSLEGGWWLNYCAAEKADQLRKRPAEKTA